MKNKLTELEIIEIETQLSCPSGENGIEVANKMNDSNIGMTKNSIEFLELEENNSVLELGHGNCKHLKLILNISNGIKYFGLEISKTMWEEAQRLNVNKQAEFKLYNGKQIPFPDNFFNRIFTVNTVYFWSNPKELMQEIERTLKTDGVFILTFADKSFMKSLPFVGAKFKLYDKDDIENLLESSNLKIIDFKNRYDEVKSKAGDMVTRSYTIVKMKKQ